MLDSKRRAIIFFILALLFAAIAGFMFLQKLQELNTELGEMAEVYVASQGIHPRAIITEDMLDTEVLPIRYVTDSHMTNPDEIVGQMSRISLDEGDLITKSIIKDLEQEPLGNNRLVRILQGGNVQFEATPDFQDRIDLVVTRDVNGTLETELFMEDVLVAGRDGTENFRGIFVEVSMDEAIDLIDTQLTAHHIRVLSANSGFFDFHEAEVEEAPQEEEAEEEQPADEEPDEAQEEEAANEQEDEQDETEEETTDE